MINLFHSKFPFIQQQDAMDCGPTCLRMIAKYYGKDFKLSYLQEKTQIGKEGVNLLGISEAAETIGFRTHAAKLSLRILSEEAALPAILHWNQNHFVVLYRFKKNRYYISDPAAGLIILNEKEFKRHWVSDKTKTQEEGIVLLLDPSAQLFNQNHTVSRFKQPSFFHNAFSYLRPHKKLISQLFLGIGMASVIQLLLPFLTQSIVDEGISTSNIHFVTLILFAQLALFAGRLAVEFVRSWILLHVGTQINISILIDFLSKLLRLPISFFDSKRTGDLIQRINDHSRIENFLTGTSLTAFFSLINLLVFSIVLAIYNYQIFFIFFLAATFYAIWVLIFLRKRKIIDYKRFEAASKEQSLTIHLIQAMQEIKLHGIEKQMRWAWQQLQARLFKLSIENLTINQLQQSGASLINEGKNILITFLSANAVINGHMTLGGMLAVQYIIGQLNSPVEQLVSFSQSWQNAKISLSRLNEIQALEDEEPEDQIFQKHLPPQYTKKLAGGIGQNREFLNEQDQSLTDTVINDTTTLQDDYSIPSSSLAIHLENVSFTYAGAGNEPVLKDINLTIPKGKTTAIVGVSGSGKTTLLKLLLKFYPPQEGTIILGDTPLNKISHKIWRSYCGVVMQESFIFSDTIARNIAVGMTKIDTQRLHYATHIANIKDFVSELPLGYNTKIGSEGIGISMGQKQRILIARAVYRNPQFIFFDEATNSLDAENERRIVTNLSSFLQGRTVVVVAHRLSTVKKADQIVVLTKGKIAEKGTHAELILLKGSYYHLVKDQLELGN